MIEEPTVVYVDVSGSMTGFHETTRRLIQDLIAKNRDIVAWYAVNSEGVKETNSDRLMHDRYMFSGGGGEEQLLDHIIDGSFVDGVPTRIKAQGLPPNLNDWRLIYITDGESRLIPDLMQEDVEIISVQAGDVLAANYSRAVFESMKTIAQQSSNIRLPVLLRCGYVYSHDQKYPAALVARRLEDELDELSRALNRALDPAKDALKRNVAGIEIYKDCRRILQDNAEVLKTFPHLYGATNSIMQGVAVNIFGVAPENARDFTTTSSPQEDTPMASIKTTVSLDLSRTHRATLADLKTLITEVEHVGGTDESYVDLSQALSTYRFDAIVVTASVQDSRLTDALAIADDGARTSALIALLDTELRDEVKKHLVAAKAKKA